MNLISRRVFRSPGAPRTVCVLLGVAAVLTLDASCDRSTPARSEASPAATQPADPSSPSPGPADVVRRANEDRTGGRYKELAARFVPEQRTAVMDMVSAVDELISKPGRIVAVEKDLRRIEQIKARIETF